MSPLLTTIVILAILRPRMSLAYIGVEETFFRTTNINTYKHYGSVQLFEYTVPEATSQVRWAFQPAINNMKCPQRNITILLQHGSYPVPLAKNNFTYPDNFYLTRTSLRHLEVPSDSNTTTEMIIAPLAGRWFGAAFIDYKEPNDVIGQINDLNCDYYLDVNVTSYYLTGCDQIVPQEAVSVNITYQDGGQLFRFYVEKNIYRYSVSVTDCDSVSGECPLRLRSRGNALPVDPAAPPPAPPYSHTTVCVVNSTAGPGCDLEVLSPLVGAWHYILIELTEDHPEVSVSVMLQLQGCSIPIVPAYQQPTCDMEAADNLDNTTSINQRSNDTKKKKVPTATLR